MLYPSATRVTELIGIPNSQQLHQLDYWLVYSLLQLEIISNASAVTVQLKAIYPKHNVFLRDGKGGFNNPQFTGKTALDALNNLLSHLHTKGGCVQYNRRTRNIEPVPPLQKEFSIPGFA
jgi:hypothetical protein